MGCICVAQSLQLLACSALRLCSAPATLGLANSCRNSELSRLVSKEPMRLLVCTTCHAAGTFASAVVWPELACRADGQLVWGQPAQVGSTVVAAMYVRNQTPALDTSAA